MIPEDIQVKSFSEAFLQKDGNIAGWLSFWAWLFLPQKTIGNIACYTM
jgi:hypothetical protein